MTATKNYDLVIIGSGPGGYVAGLYASRVMSVCVIEEGLVGGTCLNRGCIPTKSLINSASIIQTIKDSVIHGINVESCKVDFDKMSARKAEVILRLRTGIETLFRAKKVDLLRGHAVITGPNTIAVAGIGEIGAKNIIIATGSRVSSLPNIQIDEKNVLSSDGILDIKAIPESITVVGGGVIGCEFASLFNMLGSKVTIIELTERLLPTQSREAAKKLELIFKKRGVDVYTSSKVESINQGESLQIHIEGGSTIASQKMLVSVGRAHNTSGLGLEKLSIKTEKGRIEVDEGLRTTVKNIYAIGDCVSGPQLAHKASYDAGIACDNILGGDRKKDYSNIPSCIWTDPEIGSVGISEEEAKAKYPDARIAKFPYLASGKAFLEGKTEGFVKIIGDAKGKVLGVEIFGKGACDLISEAVVVKTAGISIEEWSHSVHGHPTISEVLQEAAHLFCGKPIHSI